MVTMSWKLKTSTPGDVDDGLGFGVVIAEGLGLKLDMRQHPQQHL